MSDIWGQRCAVHDVALRPDGGCILCERGKPRTSRPAPRTSQAAPPMVTEPPRFSVPPRASSDPPAEPRVYEPGPNSVTPRPSVRVQPYTHQPSRMGTVLQGLLFVACVGFIYLWFTSPQTLKALFE